jgi:hypothetical protein
MSNGKMFYQNLLTSGNIAKGIVSLSVTSETVSLEKKYLYDSNPSSLWKASTTSTQYIIVSFLAPTPIKSVQLLNYNLVSGNTFQFEGCANSAFNPPAVTQVIDPAKGFIELSWTYQYYRFTLLKPSAYVQIGELLIFGGNYEFVDNFNWKYKRRKEIVWKKSESKSGQIIRKLQFVRYGYYIEFTELSDDQQAIFETIAESDYLVFFPYGTTDIYYYGCADFSDSTHESPGCWSMSCSFTENPK